MTVMTNHYLMHTSLNTASDSDGLHQSMAHRPQNAIKTLFVVQHYTCEGVNIHIVSIIRIPLWSLPVLVLCGSVIISWSESL